MVIHMMNGTMCFLLHRFVHNTSSFSDDFSASAALLDFVHITIEIA